VYHAIAYYMYICYNKWMRRPGYSPFPEIIPGPFGPVHFDSSHIREIGQIVGENTLDYRHLQIPAGSCLEELLNDVDTPEFVKAADEVIRATALNSRLLLQPVGFATKLFVEVHTGHDDSASDSVFEWHRNEDADIDGGVSAVIDDGSSPILWLDSKYSERTSGFGTKKSRKIELPQAYRSGTMDQDAYTGVPLLRITKRNVHRKQAQPEPLRTCVTISVS
jgi:hypothetical protein